jgi:glycogen operon protein
MSLRDAIRDHPASWMRAAAAGRRDRSQAGPPDAPHAGPHDGPTASAPEPLGVHQAGSGALVAIPAPGVEHLDFCLFDASGQHEIGRTPITDRTGDVLHGLVPGVAPGSRYGLRARGPWDPARGLRCNPAKLLLDPWARRIDRPFALHPAMVDDGALPDPTDSAPVMPKAVLEPPLPPAPPPRGGTAPRVIYELHVRGFTRRHPAIPEAIRGTFAALAHPAAIAHLHRLGVTHVELMPAAAWIDERHLRPLGLTNYWGYNPVGFLAPDPRLAPGGMAEVRAAVAALQAAGIGVILDVVLNHSGEGDAAGPTLSLRGLGDAAWYRTLPDAPRRYANDAGCGNSLALDRPWPMRLAMDALRHWVAQAGLDGLRLDLATTLGRRDTGFDPAAPLLLAMRQDPVLRGRLIIAEPWDVGDGGYRLGSFPPGWGEWNDRFRDDVRRFWRGDPDRLGDLARRLAGSGDVFAARASADSVNYVAAHDGFTLADLVSHATRHNQANGEDGRDGSVENFSWNCGQEGATDDPLIRAARLADQRALLATLFAARGTPMLGMGDEAGRSQGGNNNAYCQDNAVSWLDWAGMDEALVAFTARLVAIRRAHPALAATRPLDGGADAGRAPDVRWLRLDGAAMTEADWHAPGARSLAMLLSVAEDQVLVVVHGAAEPGVLVPPDPPGAEAWTVLVDSAAPERAGLAAGPLPLAPRSVVLLAAAPR